MINTLEELNLALSSKDQFRHFIEDGASFLAATQKFPDHAEALIGQVLNDPEEFKRLIQTNREWREAAKAFPHYAGALIQPVLTDPEEFKRLISETTLLDTIDTFSAYEDSLLKVITSNSDIFAHVLPAVTWLQYYTITSTTTSLKCVDMFLQKIFDDPKEFQRLIKNVDNVIALHNIFKDKNFVIQPIIDNPQEFKRLFKSDEDLKKADKAFPNHHAIFGKPTVEEAQRVVEQQHQESVDYTKGATMGALAGGEFSRTLPADVSNYIGTFFNRREGGRLAQVREDAHKEAIKQANPEESQKPDVTPKGPGQSSGSSS